MHERVQILGKAVVMIMQYSSTPLQMIFTNSLESSHTIVIYLITLFAISVICCQLPQIIPTSSLLEHNSFGTNCKLYFTLNRVILYFHLSWLFSALKKKSFFYCVCKWSVTPATYLLPMPFMLKAIDTVAPSLPHI